MTLIKADKPNEDSEKKIEKVTNLLSVSFKNEVDQKKDEIEEDEIE